MEAKEIAEFWLAQSNRDRLISLPEVEAIKQVSHAYLDLLKQHEGKVLVPVEQKEIKNNLANGVVPAELAEPDKYVSVPVEVLEGDPETLLNWVESYQIGKAND